MIVNFDIFAFNSKFICNIAHSLQNVLNLNTPDPCPVILLPDTSPSVIRQIDYMLQTGSCVIWREEEGLEILEVADMLGLPISGRGRSPEGSEEKTSLPKPKFPEKLINSKTHKSMRLRLASSSKASQGGSEKATSPVHLAKTRSKDAQSTPKRSGASLSRRSFFLDEMEMMSPVVNATPDNSSRRDSIMSNCGTPINAMYLEPVDEFLTKGGDSRPEKRSNKKPLTTKNCNFELTCEVCGKSQKTALALEIHVCAHFKKDLEKKVSCYMTEDNRCKICGDSFKTKNGLVTHIGSKHGELNKVLADKGFAVLPCRVNSSGYTDSKQLQLVKIKNERKENVQEAQQMDDRMKTGVNERTS